MSQNLKFFQLIPTNPQINFIGKFRFFMAFSVVTLIAIVVAVSTKGLNYGIDFTGGTVVQAKFAMPTPPERVRAAMEKLNAGDASVVALGTEGTEYLITTRLGDEKGSPLQKRLVEEVGGADKVQILKAEVVGPKVGSELKGASLQALFYSVILIAIYIWFRFDFRFAPGATLAMIHDLVMTTGFYYVTRSEFTITAVAALLTIAGYSVNDTIVIYDRVRETLRRAGNAIPLEKAINDAVNVTLSRTILTALVTLISIVPIAIFCDGEIRSFAIAMCFGIFVGCYSTIYIASPFTIYVERFLERRNARRSKPRVVPAKA